MSMRTIRNVAVLLIAIALSFASAFARDNRKEHGRAGDGGRHHERMERRVEHRRWERSRTREHWQNQRERWRAEHARNNHHPNGWNHGNKTGWGGNSVPPGQAKKDDGRMPFHQNGNRTSASPTRIYPSTGGTHSPSNTSTVAQRWPDAHGKK